MVELLNISDTPTNKLLIRYCSFKVDGFCYLRITQEFRRQLLQMAELASLAKGHFPRFCGIKSFVPDTIKLKLLAPNIRLERLSSNPDFIADFYSEKAVWYLNKFNSGVLRPIEYVSSETVLVEIRGDNTFNVEFFPHPTEKFLFPNRAFTFHIPIDFIRPT
jgi:hypothetical protein